MHCYSSAQRERSPRVDLCRLAVHFNYVGPPMSSHRLPGMDKRLLLVLDLNGTIVLRSKAGNTVFHRPYLRTFLQYLSIASRDPKRSGLSATEVVIWSSARPQSVEKIVKDVFGPSSSLLAIWDRTHLGLSEKDYSARHS